MVEDNRAATKVTMDELFERFRSSAPDATFRERLATEDPQERFSLKILSCEFGHLKLAELSPAKILAFCDSRLALGLIPSTVLFNFVVLHTVVTRAIKDWGYELSDNPVDKVKPAIDNPNARGDGNTPLHYAVMNDHNEMVELLLDAGADATITNNDKWPTLCLAADYNSHHVMKSLIQSGLAVNELGGNGAAALHIACRGNRAQAARQLIRLGADINTKDRNGDTPLHIAATQAALATVIMLVEADADQAARNAQNLTPLNLYREKGNAHDADLLDLLVRRN